MHPVAEARAVRVEAVPWRASGSPWRSSARASSSSFRSSAKRGDTWRQSVVGRRRGRKDVRGSGRRLNRGGWRSGRRRRASSRNPASAVGGPGELAGLAGERRPDPAGRRRRRAGVSCARGWRSTSRRSRRPRRTSRSPRRAIPSCRSDARRPSTRRRSCREPWPGWRRRGGRGPCSARRTAQDDRSAGRREIADRGAAARRSRRPPCCVLDPPTTHRRPPSCSPSGPRPLTRVLSRPAPRGLGEEALLFLSLQRGGELVARQAQAGVGGVHGDPQLLRNGRHGHFLDIVHDEDRAPLELELRQRRLDEARSSSASMRSSAGTIGSTASTGAPSTSRRCRARRRWSAATR